MKNIEKFLVAALIIITSLLSQTVVAASFPASGAGVDNSVGSSGSQSPSSSSSSSGYVAPAATPVILGGSGTSASDPYNIASDGTGDVPFGSPTETDGSLYYYILSSGAGFKIGDYVTADGGATVYVLQASVTHPGYLEAVLTSDPAQGMSDTYFLLPVGNGNIILAVLILTYGFYIFYRKKKKEQSSIEVKKAIL